MIKWYESKNRFVRSKCYEFQIHPELHLGRFLGYQVFKVKGSYIEPIGEVENMIEAKQCAELYKLKESIK